VRIAYVTAYLPLPNTVGGRHADYNLVKELSRRHEVHLAAPASAEEEGELKSHPVWHRLGGFCKLPPLKGEGASRIVRAVSSRIAAHLSPEPRWVLAQDHPEMRRELSRFVRVSSFDVVLVVYNELSRAILPLREAATGSKILFYPLETVSLGVERELGMASGWGRRLRLRAALRRAIAFERKLYTLYDAVIAISPEERERLTERLGETKVYLVPASFDEERFMPEASQRRNPHELLFVGSVHRPNTDAAGLLLRQIFPMVKREVPEAKLYLVGNMRIPPVECDGVVKTGFVPDVREYFARCGLFVAPMRTGGGMRLKLLEAMAMGTPVLTTGVGAAGIEAEPGKEILIAREADEFAAQAIRAIEQPEEAAELGRRGCDLVNRLYAAPRVASMLESVFDEVLSRG